jgi:glycosyltransferase involved in cell wall biosynthesis
MKILYFHQHFVTPRGAGAIRSFAMARRLIERGHQVTIICGSFIGGNTGLSGPYKKGMRRGLVDGIDVIELDLVYSNHDNNAKRSLTFLMFALRSVRLTMSEPCDLVFATTTPLTAGIPGIAARWLRGKPFVFEVRDLWPELPRAMGAIRNPLVLSAMSLLEWASYRSAHALVGLSPGIVEGISSRGISLDRIALIPNGCDIDLFANGAVPWRPEGVLSTDLMAVFAGTHSLANGLDTVLDAAAELMRRKCHNIKLVLIGNGKLKRDLQARSAREGLVNVIFHDPVSKARLACLMTAADLGLQVLKNVPAFYFGTSPNKFFDYIAAGLPVLNNYPGWLASIIQENSCGFVVPPDSPIAFADALEAAERDRSALKAAGQRAQALAKTQFDRRLLADRLVDWIESVKV